MQETKIERRRRLDRENYHRRKADPNYRKHKADSAKKYNSTVNGKFYFYKRNAKKRGIEFELTKDEFSNMIEQNCTYCGDSERIGIDRKDNNKGYTLENSVPCCTSCNYMKKDLSVKEFIDKCNKVVIHNKRK